MANNNVNKEGRLLSRARKQGIGGNCFEIQIHIVVYALLSSQSFALAIGANTTSILTQDLKIIIDVTRCEELLFEESFRKRRTARNWRLNILSFCIAKRPWRQSLEGTDAADFRDFISYYGAEQVPIPALLHTVNGWFSNSTSAKLEQITMYLLYYKKILLRRHLFLQAVQTKNQARQYRALFQSWRSQSS